MYTYRVQSVTFHSKDKKVKIDSKIYWYCIYSIRIFQKKVAYGLFIVSLPILSSTIPCVADLFHLDFQIHRGPNFLTLSSTCYIQYINIYIIISTSLIGGTYEGIAKWLKPTENASSLNLKLQAWHPWIYPDRCILPHYVDLCTCRPWKCLHRRLVPQPGS